eukprot:scaffold26940_cov117-Phaeocystis_antarctica.AAC.11
MASAVKSCVLALTSRATSSKSSNCEPVKLSADTCCLTAEAPLRAASASRQCDSGCHGCNGSSASSGCESRITVSCELVTRITTAAVALRGAVRLVLLSNCPARKTSSRLCVNVRKRTRRPWPAPHSETRPSDMSPKLKLTPSPTRRASASARSQPTQGGWSSARGASASRKRASKERTARSASGGSRSRSSTREPAA